MTINFYSIFCLFIFVLLLLFGGANASIFESRQGTIRGYTVKANGVDVNVFKSIPFAKPPLRDLRFQRPQKPEKWLGIKDGTKYAPACMTNATVTRSKPRSISEDCLYLNVFADSRCTRKDPCPVIVLIHGGAFQGDSATMFNETHLLEKYASDRFIFVLTTYRLGVFGLLDLGQELDKEPYNIAVYDIVQSLEWVQDELPVLGGNTSSITLFGYSSSGATILTFLASPPIPEHLFQQAFISSGCPRLRPHFSESMSLSVLNYVGCNTTADLHLQVKCLRSKPAKALSDALRATVNDKWWSIGVQMDKYFYPASTLPALRQNWKPKPLVLMSTVREMSDVEEVSVPHICTHYMNAFGYMHNATLEECTRRYEHINETDDNPFYQDVNHALGRDIQHASNVMLSSWNVQAGQPAYVGLFAQENHNYHVGDLYYLIGFHYDQYNRTKFDDLMEELYVNAFKRFVRGQAPLDGWQPVDQNGTGYYYFEFSELSGEKFDGPNATEIIRPQFRKNEVYNEESVEFWLIHERTVEANAVEETRNAQNGVQTRKAKKKASFLQENVKKEASTLPLKPLSEIFKLPTKRLHPLHNIFLVILALGSSAAAFVLILMLLDALRSGRLLQKFQDENATEASENTALVQVSGERKYTEI